MHINLGLVSLENNSSLAFSYQNFPVDGTSTSLTVRSVTSRENTSEMWTEIMELRANTLAV